MEFPGDGHNLGHSGRHPGNHQLRIFSSCLTAEEGIHMLEPFVPPVSNSEDDSHRVYLAAIKQRFRGCLGGAWAWINIDTKHKYFGWTPGSLTEVEYAGLRHVLRRAVPPGFYAEVWTDSRLLIDQLQPYARIKDPEARRLRADIRYVERLRSQILVMHSVPRELNLALEVLSA
jgi:hypothetical protein